MDKKTLTMIGVIGSLLLTGCESDTSTLTGAGLGTAAGAGIGYAIDGGAGGAILGGVLGGLGGAALGSHAANESDKKYEAGRREGSRSSQRRYDDSRSHERNSSYDNAGRRSFSSREEALERKQFELEQERRRVEWERQHYGR